MGRQWAWWMMAQCGLFVCIVSTITQSAPQDSCNEIGRVLTERFHRHTSPQDVQNLFTCNKGVTCCNSVSEYLFEKNVADDFTKFALYTLNRRLSHFKDGMFSQQVNWEVFSGLIQQVEDGLPISYEHFFELALFEIITIKPECVKRKEIKQLKREAMRDIITLVNNIYAYQKGVQAINITLLATASLRPSKKCSNNVSKAGVPLDLTYQPAGCPLCLDTTAHAKVCRDLCLNVVRGCYASVLQYKDLYLQLVHKMDEIYFTLNYHLEMQNGSLYSFIGKIEQNLKQQDFSDSCSGRSSEKKMRRRRRRQSAGPGPDLAHFEEFFSKTLELESAIVDPATLPCAGSNNTPPCWNGNGIGNYKHLAYSYTKEEQEINPEGADLELTEEQESAVRMMEAALELAQRTTNNQTLFPVMKAAVEPTTEPPLLPQTDDPEDTSNQTRTEEPKDEPIYGPANTIAPGVDNNVEQDPDQYNVDNNPREADDQLTQTEAAVADSNKSNKLFSGSATAVVSQLCLFLVLFAGR